MTRNKTGNMLSDYARLNTLPAFLGIVFAVSSLYAFGGLQDITLLWGYDYTLTGEHAFFAALATYVLAFASSDTKSFDEYADWEMGMIAAGPVILAAHQYSTTVSDMFVNNDPHLSMIAFAVVFVGWGIAIR